MSGPRDIQHPPKTLALKVASKDLVRAAGGGEAAAEACGSRQQRMSDCGNRNTGDFLRIDEIASLEDVTSGVPGHPIVTRNLARRQGYDLVRRPEVEPSCDDWLAMLADHAGKNGEIAAGVCDALANDHVIDASEAGMIRQLVAAGLEHLAAMDAALAIIEREN